MRIKIITLSLIAVTIYSCGVKSGGGERFSREERELIEQGDEKSPMRVTLTTNREDSLLLRAQSAEVNIKRERRELKKLIDRMLATVTDSASLGVGIAAPQVGISKRVILVERRDREEVAFEAYINPIIIDSTKRKQRTMEGCLSIPNARGITSNRAYAILVGYTNLEGERREELVEGFTAVIFQHEIDHLNGILFIDHL